MIRRLGVITATLVALGVVATGDRPPRRIVSLVPAATEMLFAMGAGPRVIAVSSFDEASPAVRALPKVGALFDPDLERILSLRPDLVVVYATQNDLRQQLSSARVPMFEYRHGGLKEVFRTMRALGTSVGSRAEAERLAGDLERRLEEIKRGVGGRRRPKTLLVFGREPLSLRNIYASGGVGFLHDMLELAGATNIFADVKRESVQATTETILARAPEVIIELRYAAPLTAQQIAAERATWDALASLPAVRQRRVHLLVGNEFVVPGPRIADATLRLARTLHPKAAGGRSNRNAPPFN
ncbi:MAG: ABC transporter substrate-binding protein [Acidobacteria bacterium]|nr:ABC transporter substrate-binding protein [Acidobacteriota bacterium]